MKKKKPSSKAATKKLAIKKNPFNWVEIPVTDIERAKTFYAGVFGFKFEMLTMNGLTMAFFPSDPKGWGCGGSLMQSDMYKPSHEGPMVYFSVLDIEATLAKAEKSGGQIFKHKESIGQFGFIGFFGDSEGNRIGLHSLS